MYPYNRRNTLIKLPSLDEKRKTITSVVMDSEIVSIDSSTTN